MKYFIRIAILLVVLILPGPHHARSEAQKGHYPDYLEILEHAYSKYRLTANGHDLEWIKDPQGWAVAQVRNNEERTVHRLWDRKKRRFLKPPGLVVLSRGEVPDPPLRDDPWSASYYRFCPYYGYDGWYDDVIQEYGQRTDLPDSIVYGIARAWSSATRCLINDQYGDCRTIRGTDVPVDWIAYERSAAMSIAWYDRLVTMNPRFETHVGEATLKRDNERMSIFLDRWIVDPKGAMVHLPQDAYDPFYLQEARTYLASCAPNGILFTNGDSDTFPLLYLQWRQGFRQDVLVLNLSMLNLPAYVSAVRDGVMDAPALGLSFTDEQLSNKASEVIILQENGTPVKAREAVLACQQQIDRSKNIDYPSVKLKVVSDTLADKSTWKWSFSKHYLLRNKIILLDILHSHAADRPIHWAVTIDPAFWQGLEDNLFLCGYTHRFMPLPLADSTALIIARRGADVFMDGTATRSNTPLTRSMARSLWNRYLHACSTATRLDQLGDTVTSRDLLRYLIATYPDTYHPFGRVMLLPMEQAYQFEENELGDHIAITLMHNLKDLPLEPSIYSEKGRPDDGTLREAVLDRIQVIAEEYERTMVLEALEDLPAGWPPVKRH